MGRDRQRAPRQPAACCAIKSGLYSVGKEAFQGRTGMPGWLACILMNLGTVCHAVAELTLRMWRTTTGSDSTMKALGPKASL